jgi:protein O-mannosyl-transferase
MAPNPRLAWRRHALLLLALCAAALLAYANSFRGGLVYDNAILIGQDTRIRAVTPENIDLIWTQDYWYNWSVTENYRPLTTLSYLFNYTILGGGTHPAGYHWINFALHAINLVLVYLLGLRVWRETAPAFALAAVWALHPILTESVTNVIGRADLLAAFGVLAGLLCHTMAGAATGWRKAAWLGALMLAVTIGLFSKESAVAVLPAVLIYDLAFPAGVSWRARAPGYLALAAPLAIFLYVRDEVLSKLPSVHAAFADNPLLGADFLTARITAIKVIGKYLWRLVWPAHLSCDYSYNQVPLVDWPFHSAEDWKALVALAACAGLAALAIRCYRRNPPVFFFIALFFAALAPTANILMLIGTIMAERLLYLPSLGFAGCLVAAAYAGCRRLSAVWPGARLVAPAALGLVCLAYTARTYARNADWRSEETLWTSAVQVCPLSFKTHMSLAAARLHPGGAGMDDAIREGEKAVAILDPLPDDRTNATVYVNVGSYYRQKGDLLAPKNPDGTPASDPRSRYWYQKSLDTLLRAQRFEAARQLVTQHEDQLHGKVPSDSGWHQLNLELGRTYMRLGDPRQALEVLERGRRRRLAADFFVEMSAAWRALGELPEAAITLIEGLVVDTSNTRFAAGLVELYKQMDPEGCALRSTGGAMNLNLDCPLVHGHVCTASRNVVRLYLQMGRGADAARTSRSAAVDLGCGN